ncbi:MAG: hypothetical protein GX593_13130, partial [Actinomycetales bacterium]|nr:hypothetical protein [Actinomycetales bacterium]
MGAHGRMADVELVEGGGFDVSPDEPAVADVAGPWRVLPWWPVVLVALLLACAYAVQGARERAGVAERLAVLQSQPTFLTDLESAPRRAWSTDGVADLYTASVAGDLVIVRDGPVANSSGQVAIDASTGERRWELEERPGAVERCGGASPGLVTCVVHRFASTRARGYGLVPVLAELRDAATGEVVR